jgi:ATP-dependent Clp protease ATP-binding subunit ClpA
VFESYSNLARLAIMFARMEAGKTGAPEIDSEHLLVGTMRVDPVTISEVVPALTLDLVRERASTWHAPAPKLPNSVDLPVSEGAQRVFDRTAFLAKDRQDPFIRTEHLLLALIIEPSHAAEILSAAGVELHQVEQLVRDRLGAGQQMPEASQQGDWSIGFQEGIFS